nr:integrase, catalytic region, zinc finger, CCHC-type, peptidase aspartic, catalytic [Tanacetum cinerariifolium]
MDLIISLGQKNTLAEYMILSGADNRPHMLDKDLYDSWKSRMELYMQNREHGRMILESVEHGLPADIYSLVNHHRVAKDLWERVQLLMQGTSLTKQEREYKLYDAFDKFTHIKGKSLYTYYLRCTQLINDMNIYKIKMEQFQVNTKFLNSLSPKWSKFVTDVKRLKDLHTSNYDQLHAYLEQHELHANEVRLMRFVVPVFSPRNDPIACLNKAMAFLTAVASLRFPFTNNQLRTSCNPKKPSHHSRRQGDEHMAKQCTQPKRPRNVAWYKEKAMLAEAQEAEQMLDEEQLAFLVDPEIPASQAQTIIPHNDAFQTKDPDTYDSDYDDLSTGQAVLMANISNYGSEVISVVPHSETYLNDMNSQSVHALQDFEQSPVMDFTDNEISGKATVDNATQIPFATTAALGMFKLDLEPLAPKLVHNREIHINYLKHTQEQADILRGIVEQAKAKQPLDNALDFACNTKNNKISQPSSSKKINKVEDQHKSVKTRKNKKNHVNKVKCNDHVMQSMSNANSISVSIKNAPVKDYVNDVKSGCLCAICGRTFTIVGNLCPLTSKFLGMVRFGNDQIARIMGYNDYQLGNVIISRVYYVEGLEHNLFSVGQFCDANLEVAFRKNTCFIRNLEGVDLLSGSRDTNLYIISLDDMLKSSSICLLSKASKTKSWLWHRRLSHLNFGTLNKLVKDDLARGIPRLKFQKDYLCSACALGKSKKLSHQPKAEDTNQEKLYFLHMDLCGPMCVANQVVCKKQEKRIRKKYSSPSMVSQIDTKSWRS